MDWKKAKTILICLFVIINGILSLQLYLRRQNSTVLSSEQLQDVKKLLIKGNLHLKTQIPKKTTTQPTLEIRISSSEVPNIIKHLINKGYKKTKQGIYEKEDEQIHYISNSEFVYKSTGVLFIPKKFTKEEIKKSAEKMLSFLQISKREYVLVDCFEANNEYFLGYYKKYKNKVLFDTGIQIRVSPLGIKEVNINTIEPIRFTPLTSKDEIQPVTAALVQVMRNIQNGTLQKTFSKIDPNSVNYVTDLSFGYFFNPQKNSWSAGTEGTASKVWRIVLNDKDVIYVNAVDLEIIPSRF